MYLLTLNYAKLCLITLHYAKSADPLWAKACRCGLQCSNKLTLIDHVYKLLVAKFGMIFGKLELPESPSDAPGTPWGSQVPPRGALGGPLAPPELPWKLPWGSLALRWRPLAPQGSSPRPPEGQKALSDAPLGPQIAKKQ